MASSSPHRARPNCGLRLGSDAQARLRQDRRIFGIHGAYVDEPDTQGTFTYSNGRLATAGARMYHYNSLGQRDWEGHSTNASETSYVWQGDRLARMSGPNGSGAYVYDATGQRVQSVTTLGSITTTTTCDYDGSVLLGLSATRSDDTTYSINYMYDEKGVVFAGVYRASDASSAVPFMMVTTDRGDVRELLDSAGNSFARYDYDPYGNDQGMNVEHATALVPLAVGDAIRLRQPMRYASYVYDTESDLYYCSQRYYDPATMQFISKDPARADGEKSAYLYCEDNPATSSDPSGLINPDHDPDGVGYWGDDKVHASETTRMHKSSYYKYYWHPYFEQIYRDSYYSGSSVSAYLARVTAEERKRHEQMLAKIKKDLAKMKKKDQETLLKTDKYLRSMLGESFSSDPNSSAQLGFFGPMMVTGSGSPEWGYHYTFADRLSSIFRADGSGGLWGPAFVSPKKYDSFEDAQENLALSNADGLRNVVIRVNLAKMRSEDIAVPEPTRVQATTEHSNPQGEEIVMPEGIAQRFLEEPGVDGAETDVDLPIDLW